MKIACMLLCASLAAAAPPSFSRDEPPRQDADGLVKAKVTGLQSVYARPDANLGRYDKVMLEPIAIAFSKSWERQSDPQRLTEQEKQTIQRSLERILREEFGRELGRGGHYRMAEEPGQDVLRIKAEIRDLHINAPDLQRAEIKRSYTKSAGEMTLVAELRDSLSGELLARVTDRAKDPESAWFELTTRVDNVAAARRAAAEWARILRAQLDAARPPAQR